MPVYWHRGRIFMWFPFLADTNISFSYYWYQKINLSVGSMHHLSLAVLTTTFRCTGDTFLCKVKK